MLIRKNTKAYKTILEIITACKDRPDREKLIRLYITKAGHSIKDRINVEGIQGEAGLFYEMNYHAVLNNLKSANHQLHQSDDVPGVYFFHSSNKTWDETPFEFDEAIEKHFGSLTDLPAVRKKEKIEKYSFPAAEAKGKSTQSKTQPAKKDATESKKSKPSAKARDYPDYKLKHEIDFTDLDKIVFRQPRLSKKDVLDYYDNVTEQILPYLKDRALTIRSNRDGSRNAGYSDIEALAHKREVPEWIQQSRASKSKRKEDVLLCNDKEHLLFYIELGAQEFDPSNSKLRSNGMPDYAIIGIEPPGDELGKAIDVALAAKEILEGIKLPSFVKTVGMSGLHLYIPLDAKSGTDASRAVAEYICKLIRLKVPDLVTLGESSDQSYGKVLLDFLINDDGGSSIAPYSLASGDAAIVATPLFWEEVNESLQPEYFTHETIFKRLKESGDPWQNFFKKKVNAETLLERLEANYSFLL